MAGLPQKVEGLGGANIATARVELTASEELYDSVGRVGQFTAFSKS
jgi:hypothetical protein